MSHHFFSRKRTRMSCDRVTNNKFPSCPPLMSDGRAFTDHRPKGLVAVQDIVPTNLTSYEYRQHMERNGELVQSAMRRQVYEKNACGPCDSKKPPELGVERCGLNTCAFLQTSPDGIGLGRDFGMHISSEHDSFTPCVTVTPLSKYDSYFGGARQV
jgi:hypothetical protein